MLKWGVIGCGHIANTFADGLACLDDGELIACASASLERARDWADGNSDKHQITKIYGSYEQLLQDSEIDAVYVANTHNFHYQSVKRCLLANKHVLCEKPITLNAKQATELFALAKERSCFLMEGVWTRFLPAIRMLQKMLSDNSIGEVLSVRADFSLNRVFEETHRLRNKELAGGALLDLGIYPITFAYIAFGEAPNKIQSSVVLDSTGVDQRSFYLFEYAGGGRASLSSAYSHVAPTNAIIAGSEGYIEVPHFLGAQEFVVHLEGESPQTYTYPFSDDENFSFEIKHMQDCIRQGLLESPILPASESISVLQTMDELRAQWGIEYKDEH